MEELSFHDFWHGKAISITYSEPVFVALVTQDAQRMPRIILSSVACQDLRFSPQSLSEIFLIVRRILREKFVNVHRPSYKFPAILVLF
jgi:DNA polymerase III gamma/tau subunit